MLLVALVLGGVGSASARKALTECPRADWGARGLARTAEVTAEVYATEHNGYYSGMTPRTLHREEPALPLTSAQGKREDEGAYLASAESISHGLGYVVRTRATDGDTFAIMRGADGGIERTARVHGQRCTW